MTTLTLGLSCEVISQMIAGRTIKYLHIFVDLLSMGVAWYLSYYIRFHYLPNAQPGIGGVFVKLFPMLALSSIFVFYRQGLYRRERYISTIYEVAAVLKSNIVAFVVFVALVYFTYPERVSRTTFLGYFFISTFLIALQRGVLKNILREFRKAGKSLKHVLLVGNSPSLCKYIDAIRLYKDCGIKFVGWIDSDGLTEKMGVEGVYTTVAEAKKQCRVDGIVAGYSGEKLHRGEELLKQHYNDIIPIQLIPDLSYSFIGHQLEEFAGVPILTYNSPRIHAWEVILKRIFDFVASFIGMLLISPLLFLLGVLVKLSSPGPIFYGQERIGLDGRKFKMWKFRSMRLAEENEDQNEWSNKDNPRKTKVGDFIRRTSLDELPQLWNVLIGQMSLVGPRPERPHFVNQFKSEIPNYMLRHKLPPGITGWAQVNGWRGDTSIEKRIECDLYYIKNYSFYLDVKILFLTLIKGFVSPNAY